MKKGKEDLSFVTLPNTPERQAASDKRMNKEFWMNKFKQSSRSHSDICKAVLDFRDNKLFKDTEEYSEITNLLKKHADAGIQFKLMEEEGTLDAFIEGIGERK